MTEAVQHFIIGLVEHKAKLPKGILDLNGLNYIDSGYVDSIGIIKFILEIENHFDVQLSDSDIESQEFRTIGGLTTMIQAKLSGRGPS